MGTDYRADTVNGVFISLCVLLKRGVHGVFKRFASPFDADDFRAQKLHFTHVDVLFLHVRFAHENTAFKPE